MKGVTVTNFPRCDKHPGRPAIPKVFYSGWLERFTMLEMTQAGIAP
jgi:hypothetical protein